MDARKILSLERGPEAFSRAFTITQLQLSIGLEGVLMPGSKQPPHNGNNGMLMPSSKQDRIDELLREHLEYFPAKELTAAEIGRWHSDLNAYSLAAIEWAFDCHRRSGRFFPLPADIFAHLAEWEPTPDWWDADLPRGREPLRDEWPVVLNLFKQISERIDAFKERGEKYQRVTEAEAEQMVARAKAKIEASEEIGKRHVNLENSAHVDRRRDAL